MGGPEYEQATWKALVFLGRYLHQQVLDMMQLPRNYIVKLANETGILLKREHPS